MACNYFSFPTKIAHDPDLTMPEKLVLARIVDLSYADWTDPDDRFCTAFNQTLADGFSVSKKTVDKHLRRLEAKGYIRREHEGRKDGGRTRKIYPEHDYPSLSNGNRPDRTDSGTGGSKDKDRKRPPHLEELPELGEDDPEPDGKDVVNQAVDVATRKADPSTLEDSEEDEDYPFDRHLARLKQGSS